MKKPLKVINSLLTVITIVIFFSLPLEVQASDTDFEIVDGVLIRYSGSSETVIIPDNVTEIGENAFYDCCIVKLTIPNSVTTIGKSAFSNSELTSLTIPNSVTTIGDWAFNLCTELTSITIHDSETTIGKDAFSQCRELASIDVDLTNKKYTSIDGILFNKNMTKIIYYPIGKNNDSYTIPQSVTTIGEDVFDDSSLKSINIPDSVITIEESAFSSTDITEITIPKSVTTIGDRVFNNCFELTSINVNTENIYFTSTDGVLLNKSKTEIIKYPSEKSSRFYIIPQGVKDIRNEVFSNCSSLVNIKMPDSVIAIGDRAFEDC